MDLVEMYPAAVNSKVTVTLGVLNADSTIIEVLDGSVLPDAPNLLVLGSDQTAETVKLTAKEGNTLTVERGIQGNAIAWPAGTQVARNFTAKDWDDLVANVAIIVAKIMGLNAADVGALPYTTKQIDIGARPNANLLHNWYFGNPVNRNGKTEYTETTESGTWIIDRWRVRNGMSNVTVADGVLKIENISQYNTYIEQFLTKPAKGTHVVSVLVKSISGVGYVQPFYTDGTQHAPIALKEGLTSVVLNPSKEVERMFMQVNSGGTVEFIACKLELGDTQTLAHQENGVWVLNEIPDYAEQMAICQQYNATTGAYIGGSVPLNGSVAMTNNLKIQKNTYTQVSLDALADGSRVSLQNYGQHSAIWQIANVAGDTSNRRYIMIRDSENAITGELENALILREYINGSYKTYSIFGEHNKELLTEAEKALPLADGFLETGSSYYYKNADGDVVVQFYINASEDKSANTRYTIAKLPAGYRPIEYAPTAVITGSATSVKVASLIINSSGEMIVVGTESWTSVRGTVVFKAAN